MATALPNPSTHQATPLPASRTLRSPSSPEGTGSPGEPGALPGPNLMRILLNAIATITILAILFMLQGCSRGSEPEASADVQSAQIQQPQNTDAILPTPAPVVFASGQVVTSGAPIEVVADATSAAPVLEVYDGGAAFSVLEPGLDRGAYPVIADGISWVRVRAGDGLAGWVNASWLAQ